MKVVVLGFDGMDPKYTSSLFEEGELEFFNNLQRNGNYTEVDSSILPLSPMAWSNFLTGCKADKHNIYDFINCVDKENNEFKIASSLDRESPEMWDYFSEKDISIGVVTMPLTYPPPEDMDGFVVSGYPNPNDDSSYVPRELNDYSPVDMVELQPKTHYDGTNKEETIDDRKRQWDSLVEFHEYALSDLDWDVLVSVFKQTDDVSHIEWGGDSLKELYKKSEQLYIDTLEKLEDIDDEYLLIGMSDHGFGPVSGTLFLNNILRECGYVKLKSTPGTIVRKNLNKVGFNAYNAFKIATKLGLGESIFEASLDDSIFGSLVGWGRKHFFLGPEDISLEKSDCYARGNYGQIFVLNESKTEEIVQTLQNYCIDEDKLFEDVYNLDFELPNRKKNESPDIIVKTPNYEYLTARGFGLSTDKKISEQVLEREAEHKKKGVFYYSTSRDVDNLDEEIDLEDILPTICSFLEIPIPKNIDGDIIWDDLESVSFEDYEITSEDDSTFHFDDGEQEKIDEQLESLGYK